MISSWRLEPNFPSTGGSGPVRHNWREVKFEIGDTISMEEGLVGVVLAGYTRSGDARNDVHYIVELRQGADDRA